MAVAIYDHWPTAKELLEARLARGWRATPTALRTGDVVLGFAACRVSGEMNDSDTSGRRGHGEFSG